MPETDTVKDQAADEVSKAKHGTLETMKLPPLALPPNLTFGPFPIQASQAFHISPSRLSYALVNLRPLLPGHTLVCPVRRTPRLSSLTDAETADLFLTAKRISRMLERVYKADALNVAVQDGAEAGQSVNHVHVHLIPRRKGDVPEDAIYGQMDGKEGNIGQAWDEFEKLQKRRRQRETESGDFQAEGERRDRTEREMKDEAELLRWEMERQADIDEMKNSHDGAYEERNGQFP